MANDNNNINELVPDDDDPTVALEILPFEQDDGDAAEADLKTYDAQQAAVDDWPSDVSVSELQADLRSRKKSVNELQYDIQQLDAKRLGLETEISARESQTEQLNNELSSSRDALVRKDELLNKRDRKIRSLKLEIWQHDYDYRELKERLDALQLATTISPPVTRDGEPPAEELHRQDMQYRLNRTEEYADSLRQRSQDLIEANSHAGRELDNLARRLDDATRRDTQLSDELTRSLAVVDDLRSTLDDIQKRHDDEIRLLRFDLGAAQDTVVETEELNSQLASDLVDACGFKDELERMLGDAEEQTTVRVEELQKEVRKLQRTADSYEQKLTTKNEAISVLLAELAKKSEQIESIGEIDDVIQDIDEQISERSFVVDENEQRTVADRLTRVLVGTVDNQMLRFPLFKDRLTIGRTKDNDIQLKAGYVSRRHAVIQTDSGTTRIIDWGSKNGIHVNAAKVSEHFLCHGDTVIIGNARFRYEERKKRDS